MGIAMYSFQDTEESFGGVQYGITLKPLLWSNTLANYLQRILKPTWCSESLNYPVIYYIDDVSFASSFLLDKWNTLLQNAYYDKPKLSQGSYTMFLGDYRQVTSCPLHPFLKFCRNNARIVMFRSTNRHTLYIASNRKLRLLWILLFANNIENILEIRKVIIHTHNATGYKEKGKQNQVPKSTLLQM